MQAPIKFSAIMAHPNLSPLRETSPVQHLLSVIALAFVALSPYEFSTAEDLRDFLSSPALVDAKPRPTPSDYLSAKKEKQQRKATSFLLGIEPGSNFALIWSQRNNAKELLNWIGAKLPYYKNLHSGGDVKKDKVFADTTLSAGNKIYELLIVIPHPSIRPLVDANMLLEYKQYRPPAFEVISEKTIDLSTGTATLYIHKDGPASLVIPIEQSGIVQLFTKNSNDYESLIEIAKALDIDRLNRKITS